MTRATPVCLALALGLSSLPPLKQITWSQEGQPSAEAPVESPEVEFHPVASFLTAVNIPARATLCGLNSWLASIVTFFSAGMKYAEAAKMIEEGCSGPWIITPEMLEEAKIKEKGEPAPAIPGGDMVLRPERPLPPGP